ncbi:MAG: glycosyltransferase family 39 protein [Candidatus Hydrogenedentes bacterium]|nr:glycosyltransferase family 39 protein [Candidatus Hydrogenedentota bacterium]
MLRMLRRSFALPLFALILFTILLVPPAGNFPLNDDWVYAIPVKTLLDGHGYEAHPYRAAYGLFQTYWGAAFCLLFGYSHTVLRISTLLLAAMAVWLTAKSSREIGASRNVALFCGAVLLANPLFMNLSYTFMTEVPYIALMAASGYFYLRALRRGRSMDIFLGSSFAVLAFSNRQYGVLASVAFVLSLLVANRHALIRPGAFRVASFAAPWLVLALTCAVLRTLPDNPMQRIGLAGNISRAQQIGLAINALYSIPLYVGLFLLPLATMHATRMLRRPRRTGRGQWVRVFVCTGFYSLAMALGALPLPHLLPNMLRDLYVGPHTLYDTYFANRLWAPVSAGFGAWYAISFIAALSAGVMFASWRGVRGPLLRNKQSQAGYAPRRAQYWFLYSWAALLLVSPLNPALTIYFDRYLLPAMVPLFILSAAGLRCISRPVWTVAVGLVILFYGFSVASVQDYLAWNRARWDGIELLRAKYGARDEQIDGGYEFNGMYTSAKYRQAHPDRAIDYSGERPWWVMEEVYAVSLLPRDGYETIDTIKYRSWLRGDGAMYLLKKRQQSG